MNNLAYKANKEIAGTADDIRDGILVTDYATRIKALRDLSSQARNIASKFLKNRGQGTARYYSTQTQMVFGDNPDNLGPNSIINSTDELASAIEQWSKVQDRKGALPLLATPVSEAEQRMSTFFDWEHGCESRLNQLRKSLK